MITARQLRKALETNQGIKPKVSDDHPKRTNRAKKSLLPARPKRRRRHIVGKKFAWDDLEKLLRANSAHGIQRVPWERTIHPVSGLDIRRRIHALGFTVTHFARRHGVSPTLFYEMTHFPAGMILTKYIRLVEYEETLAKLVDLQEATHLSADEIRGRLGSIINEAADRL